MVSLIHLAERRLLSKGFFHAIKRTRDSGILMMRLLHWNQYNIQVVTQCNFVSDYHRFRWV